MAFRGYDETIAQSNCRVLMSTPANLRLDEEESAGCYDPTDDEHYIEHRMQRRICDCVEHQQFSRYMYYCNYVIYLIL